MTNKATYSQGSSLQELERWVDPELAMITRFTSPLLLMLGFPDNVPGVGSTHLEWLDDALKANSSTLAASSTSGDTTIDVASGTGSRFKAGDILQSEGSRELISVTSVSTDELTVVRGIRSTTAEAIASGATIRIIQNPAIEDETAPSAENTNRTQRDNYTQIFRQVVSATRSMRKASTIGVEDELAHQVMSAKKNLMRQIAYSVYNSRRQASNPEGTASAARTMDGLLYQMIGGSDSVIVDAATATLDETLLKSALRQCYEAGGNPDTIVCHPKQKDALSALLEGRQRFGPADGTLGAVVERFISDFGEQQVLAPDIFCPEDCLLILDLGKIDVVKLGEDGDPALEEVEIGTTGLADKVEVVGELSLKMRNAKDGGHALVQNLSIS